MCKYSDYKYKCLHENLEDNDYCIFHLQDDNKDIDEFNKRINELLKTEEDSINLNGFYFPPGTSYFSGHNFQKKIDFSNVIFSGKADFKNATFSRGVNFEYAEFAEESFFGGATFLGKLKFEYVKFNGKTLFNPNKSEAIIFKNTYFSDNVRIKADLSKCSFANSNIERVDMTDSTWIRDDDKSKNLYRLSLKRLKI